MRAAIRTDGLTKRYNGKTGKVALAGLGLEVPEGEVFGLLGHNGAGKTTAVSILTTLLDPTEGSAEVLGVDVVKESAKVRRLIGYLPENVQFYDSLTLHENLVFFARLSGLVKPGERIREVLRFLDFEGHEKERLSTFSKGMRQRVGIAQAILHEPSVLFLDEPTSGLDPAGVKLLRDTIVRLNAELGMTIFMNTHLLAEVTKTCTSIGILREGHLIYHDSLERTLRSFPAQDSLEEIYLHIDASGA
jgi:ABC-2 type transport system ATP-binding protein